MSRAHDDIEDYGDEEPLILDDPEEIAELEAAIADADAHPNEGIDADELIRQLREERERRYPSTR